MESDWCSASEGELEDILILMGTGPEVRCDLVDRDVRRCREVESLDGYGSASPSKSHVWDDV